MGIFKDVKDIKSSQDALNETTKKLEEWLSLEGINRQVQINQADIRLSTFSSTLETLNEKISDALTLINNNRIPAKLNWDIWIYVNDWADWFVQSFNIQSEENKVAIDNCIKTAVALGVGCMWKEGEKWFSGSPSGLLKDLNGEIIGCESVTPSLFIWGGNTNNLVISNNRAEISSSNKYKQKPKSKEIFFLSFRSNEIGDYVWFLKDMLTDIYFRYEERLAGSNLVGKMVVDINNINTLSTELKSFRDITTATGFVVKDGQFSNIANKFHYLEQGTNAQVQDLINVHKSLKNDFYNRAGRITSNEKYQTNTTEVGVELLDSGIIYQRKYYIVKNFIEELNKNGGDFYFDKGLEEQKLETVVGSNRDSSANNEEESKKGEENV